MNSPSVEELCRQIEYNATDFGELGQYIKVQYVLNILKRTSPTGVTTELGTPAEVAKLLRTNEDSLAQLRFRGTGPKYIKLEKRVLYRWRDVYEYLETNTVTSKPLTSPER